MRMLRFEPKWSGVVYLNPALVLRVDSEPQHAGGNEWVPSTRVFLVGGSQHGMLLYSVPPETVVAALDEAMS